jgi:PKD repeat protein
MSFTYKFLLALLVALAVPASAAAAPGAIRTLEHEEFGQLFMDASQADPRDNSVTILPGETVTFSYAVGDGSNAHNVDFYTFSPKPSACVQTAGTPLPGFPVPPLPAFTLTAPWAGNCTFNNPGTYSFYCTVHGEMTGTVIVAAGQNAPPTVSASRNPAGAVNTGTSIAFSAVGADADGDTLTYAWDFGDGQTATQQNPSHTYTTPGTKTAKVTVSDGKGGTGEATLEIVVNQPNRDPSVTASRDPSGNVTVGTVVAFSATGTDADGDTLTYAWAFGDGGAATTQNASHAYTAAGTYTATVTVSDGRGGTGSTTVPVTVTVPANRDPSVTASRNPSGNVTVGTAIAFSATGTDPDGDTLTYAWAFGDGDTATTQNPSHTYATAGTYTATVTVSDGRGGTASTTVPVTVTAADNQNPTVTAARTPSGNTRVGVPIAFTATGTDPDGDPLTYAWDFGDSTSSTEQNPTKAFTAAATYTVRVTVSDGRGGTGTATLTVVIQANRNPSISAATATPADGIVPLNVQFNATASDADGHAISYAWDLDGDGTFETTTQNPSYTYTTAKTHNPALRVTDGFGGSTTRTLIVNALPQTHDPAAKFNALLFTKTAGFRHSNIDEGITAIKKLGADNGYTVDAIEDASLFTDAFLARYDVAIFLSTTGDVLNDSQQAAFERFIKSGKGYVGIHAAADSEYTWPWYGQMVGGYFRNHPPGTPTATVVREDATHHSTAHLPERWTRSDEWYNYQGIVNPVVNGGGTDVSPRGLTPIHVLLTVDESTYVEADGSDGVDDDHPISWCKRYDGGRMFYTGLAHTEASFVEANFLQHLQGGIEVSAGFKPDAACGVEANSAPTVTASRAPNGPVETGQPVAFTATGEDADGDALTYAWDFGDGGSSTQREPLHTFTEAGTYEVKVTVSDGRGGTGSATLPVTVNVGSAHVSGEVGADVGLVLAVSMSGAASFGAITPGITRDYEAGVTALVTSTAGDAALTVTDSDATNPGRLVNGDYVLDSPLLTKATNSATPTADFAPVTGTPRTLLTWTRAFSADPVTLAFKQSVGAAETLRAGTYGKTLTYTLTTTTP